MLYQKALSKLGSKMTTMRFKFTPHAKEKLQKELYKFGINENIVIQTILYPDELLKDTKTRRFVAVNYSKRIAVIYEPNSEALIITIIYSSMLDKIIKRRKRSGRWV